MPIDTSKTEFKCIYIPVDASKPLQEMTVPIADGETIGAMINFVKDHITTTEQLRKSAASREQLRKERSAIGDQLQEQIKKNPQLAGVVLTDDLIDRIYLANAVDTVTLLPHCKATNFKGVVMYVDDQGVAKNLGRNTRATTIAFSVGKQTEVLGDCFIATIIDDNEDDFIRLDTTLKGLDDKTWMLFARGINLGHIKQQMPYLDVCRALQLEPEPSLLTKDQAGAAEPTAEAKKPEEKKDGEKKIDVSREVEAAYTSGNKPLRDKSGLCAQGHLDCDQTAGLRCSRCKTIFYCTAAHQKADWKRHKAECVATK